MNLVSVLQKRRISVTVVALTMVAMALYAVVQLPVADAAGGDIRVINELGDDVTLSKCSDFKGNNFPRGTIVIASTKGVAWSFKGFPWPRPNWTCHFKWTDSWHCSGGACNVHGRDVSLWHSYCVDCVWRVQRDGFYISDGRVQPLHWQFMFDWQF